MRLCKPSFEILDQQNGIEGIYKQIEVAGRNCYKSEDRITEDSAIKFVDMLVKNNHGAMLEHGTVYMFIPVSSYLHDDPAISQRYNSNKYSVVNIRNEHCFLEKNGCYITTNYRVLVENNWLDDLKYICKPTEWHEKRITVKFITDQGILREFTRHRTFSFAVESTRYCNYNKDKFSNEITFIQPNWITDEDLEDSYLDYTYFVDSDNNHITSVDRFMSALKNAEYFYMELIKLGWKPQQARNVLPLATKCDIIMTGFVKDWKHFFDLRCAPNAHPQAQELAHPLHEAFMQRDLIK